MKKTNSCQTRMHLHIYFSLENTKSTFRPPLKKFNQLGITKNCSTRSQCVSKTLMNLLIINFMLNDEKFHSKLRTVKAEVQIQVPGSLKANMFSFKRSLNGKQD